jgi:hypothetical protein
MLPAAVLLDLERGMVTAVPADHEVERVLLDTDDDLIDQSPYDALLRLVGNAGTVPGALEIGTEGHQSLAIDGTQCAGPGSRH